MPLIKQRIFDYAILYLLYTTIHVHTREAYAQSNLFFLRLLCFQIYRIF